MWASLKARNWFEPNRILLLLVSLALVASTWASVSSVRLNGHVDALARSATVTAEQNAEAICALRLEREDDVASTKKFLEPYKGKPADTVIDLGDYETTLGNIQNQLHMMEETVAALSSVPCADFD